MSIFILKMLGNVEFGKLNISCVVKIKFVVKFAIILLN